MFLSFWRRLLRRASAVGRQRRPARRPRLSFIEILEARDLPSGFYPDYTLVEPQVMAGATPAWSTSSPTGTTPAQIRHAYGFDQIKFNSGTLAGDGSGNPQGMDVDLVSAALAPPPEAQSLAAPASGGTASPAPNSALLEPVPPLRIPQGADRLGTGATIHWDFSTPIAQPASAAEWDAIFEQMAQGEGLGATFR